MIKVIIDTNLWISFLIGKRLAALRTEASQTRRGDPCGRPRIGQGQAQPLRKKSVRLRAVVFGKIVSLSVETLKISVYESIRTHSRL